MNPNKTSLIQTFSLLGTWEGAVSLHVKFDRYYHYSDQLAKILNAHQLTLNGSEVYARTSEEVTNLWMLISKNINIPTKNVKKIDAIIQEGTCEYNYYCRPLLFYS